MPRTKQTEFFDMHACDGDTISWEHEGFVFTATLEGDTDSRPSDSECYTDEDIQRWKDDEWFFVGVVLSVHRNGELLSDHAASLWGVECNFNDTSNMHLTEVAHELQDEAIAYAKERVAQILVALTTDIKE